MPDDRIDPLMAECEAARQWFLLMLQRQKEATDAVSVAWDSYASALTMFTTAVREDYGPLLGFTPSTPPDPSDLYGDVIQRPDPEQFA